jgi:hypothetical protein
MVSDPHHAPPTPPDMRVRIRRFAELRLASKSRDTKLIEVRRGQGEVKGCVTSHAPPVASKTGGHCGDVARHTPSP